MASKDTRGSTPTVELIHRHWLNKVKEDLDHYVNLLGDDTVENILIGEGCECYACGVKSKRLERCHIVPHSLGGSAKADNLFLLCGECHQDNPDTIYADLFYRYVKGRESNLNKAFGSFYKLITNFSADATDDELANLKVFTEAPLKQQLNTYQDIPIEVHSTGSGNQMSHATMAAIAWKRATSGKSLVPTPPQ